MFTVIFLLCIVYISAGIIIDYVTEDISQPILRKDYWSKIILWPKEYWLKDKE